MSTGQDLNNFDTSCVHRVSADNLKNAPVYANQYRGWMIVLGTGGKAYRWQVFCDTQLHVTYQRYATYTGEWSNWVQI